jgi:hypothetical protein
MTFKAPDSRAYHLALERRKGEMGQVLNTVAQLLQAIIDRDHPCARDLLLGYGEHNCKRVMATLAER